MLSIQEPKAAESPNSFWQHALFALPFRSFFLFASLSSIIALAIWIADLSFMFRDSATGISGIVWHIHEMIFGFAVMVAVGFILTAVQTWTGRPSITGKPVAGLLALWFLIRVCFWVNTTLAIYAAFFMQLLWWLAVISIYAKLVFAAQNRRNYLFIPLLTILALTQLAMLALDLLGHSAIALHLAKTTVFLFSLLVTVVGGRVIPFFTANGTKSPQVGNLEWLEKILLPLSAICFIAYFLSFFFPIREVSAAFFILLGLLQLIRLSRWQGGKTLKVPLLWSLHISYLFMAIGLTLMGLSHFNIAVSASSAIHLITIGTVGLMIFAMMSRVSLGHTGRMLQIKPLITFSFILMIASALSRVILAELALVQLAWYLSAALWAATAILFIANYWKILSSPRL